MKRLYHLLIIGIGLVFLDLVLKAEVPCLFWTCTPNSTFDTDLVVDSERAGERAPSLPAERISAAGVHYGYCAGTILAVVLLPEPCGWQEHPISLASR